MLTITTELTTRTGAKTLTAAVWDGQPLTSRRACPLALDTETELVTDGRRVPRLALAVASDGRSHVVIHPDRLAGFLLAHRDAYFVGHNVQFDFWVVDEHLSRQGDDRARRVLWDACDQGRLFDTQILDLLLQLGTGRFRHAAGAKDTDATVYPGTLADVAADYTVVRITKDDPYRTRFGELVGLPVGAWAHVDTEFFRYAARDAYVTYRLYPALAEAAERAMRAAGFDPAATRYDIRPDAIARFGYLGEVIQVQASVVLSGLFRRGVRIDLVKAKALAERYRAELAEIVGELQRSYPDVLAFNKNGTLRVTPKAQIPSLANGPVKDRLLKAAEEIGGAFVTPHSRGKRDGVSLSAKEWTPHADRHPCLGLWIRLKKLGKLLQTVGGLTAPVVHGEYTLLKRTGRTSCRAPRDRSVPGLNIQQMPKLAEVRELFVPDPGHRLFVGDFAAAELRTLAAVCRARYGTSRLAEVLSDGVDPHAFTAATIRGLTLEEFNRLKSSDPARYKNGRQKAKPINFGVPGGMGGERLRESARTQYAVEMAADEARQFRQTLITEVYPELNDQTGYLADDTVPDLARNLGVPVREAWEVLDPSGRRNPIAAKGAAKVIRGTSTASAYYQERVWDGLARLLNTVKAPDPELVRMVVHQEGGDRLAARLLGGSAATLTGRIRAGVGYTERKNTPFQSLCADGGKLALWRLTYAGYDVYAFVHDEILVQLPADRAADQAAAVSRIVESALEDVIGQGIPAKCDWTVADHWQKP